MKNPISWLNAMFLIAALLLSCKKNEQSNPTPVIPQDSLQKMYSYLSAKKASARPFIAFVGNSITHGVGASVQDSSYASILMRDIQDQQGTPYEPTITTDFREFITEGIDSITGTYNSFISSGPIDAFMQLNDKSQVYFHGIIDFLDVWIGDNSKIGSQLQFYKDGVLYRTVTVDKTSMYSTYNGTTTMGNSTLETVPTAHKYSIKAVGNSINVFSLIRNRYKQYDAAHRPFTFIRAASSGWTIPYFLPVMNTLTAMSGDTLGQKGIFLISVTINDILSSTSAQYEADLTNLIKGILAAGHFAIQVFPHRAVGYPMYDIFQTIAKSVCAKFNVPFITLANDDFIGNGWLLDGLHPNNIGHRREAKIIEAALANF